MPSPPGHTVFQMRVTLDEVEPQVWRRLLVPGSARLEKLHGMLQAAMGWTDSHLHAFTIGDDRFGQCFDDFPEGEIDEKTVTAIQAIGDRAGLVYEYDFGDGWEHQIVVEDRIAVRHGLKYAVCLGGQNACPPEDCGGAGGYEQLLEVLADPTHDEYEQLVEWAGGPLDPRAFDLAAVNVALQRVR